MKRVMIVGASGVFGSRLVALLMDMPDIELILAGRQEERARAILARLAQHGIKAGFTPFDRSSPSVAKLRELAPDVIVDAAGPFQGSNLALAEAAVAVRANYIDLADARDFVARIVSLDISAREAGVSVLSGASSTPALSHAVIDRFTQGWNRIDSILVAIAPGNRAPRGLSVIQAILSYAGQPVKLYREGRWSETPGWSLSEKIAIEGVGWRDAALCETPDLDLLVARYAPRVRAEFKAGLELGILHHGLRLLSCLVSFRLIRSLVFLAIPLRAVAVLLTPFGSDRGGMIVRVSGRDASGEAMQFQWSLSVGKGTGPSVPAVPAAALIARGSAADPGARAAAGEVRHDEIAGILNRLGVETRVTHQVLGPPFQFQTALGEAWQRIPEITRLIHTTDPSVILEGEADIEGAATAAGRLLARIFQFPEAGSRVPVRVVIENDGKGERWARHYPTRTMQSYMTAADTAAGTIEEHMGAFRFRLKLVGSEAGIDLVPVAVFWRGLRLPRWMLPAIAATERAGPGPRHLFDVRVELWPFGRLVHYRGWLAPEA